MKLLSYNVGGLRGKVKWRKIRKIITEEGAEFICIQETKLQKVENNICYALWGDHEVEWEEVPAINMGGGLFCLWRKGTFRVIEKFCGNGVLDLKGWWKDVREPIVVVNIYSSCHLGEKRILWNELLCKKGAFSEKSWCVVGDFNAIRSREERVGSRGEVSLGAREMKEFDNFLNNMELVDIPLHGRKFTWYRQGGFSKSRLDRFVVSEEWLNLWPTSAQHVLPRDIFDHYPLIMRHKEEDWGPKPFRVLNG